MQHTLGRVFEVQGVGLHSGEGCAVKVLPAEVGTGRVFVVEGVEIPGAIDTVVETRLATTLGVAHARVSMVEHLLAALHAAGVDNVRVLVSGPEVPVLDGSARLWLAAVRGAGVVPQGTPRRVLRVESTVRVEAGDAWAELVPATEFEVELSVDFPHPQIGRQHWEGVVSERFGEVCGARTFGFFSDAERLWASGLARGASLDNTVVYTEAGVMNADGLRWADEAVRHKVLDAVGDAALVGAEIHGRLRAYKAGHALHRAVFEKALLARG